jgi:hypothetical protein
MRGDSVQQRLGSVLWARAGGLFHQQKPANVDSQNTAALGTNAYTQTEPVATAAADSDAADTTDDLDMAKS